MRFATIARGSAGLGFLLLLAVECWAKEGGGPSPTNIRVVHAAPWSEGDPAREGAAELGVLVEIARLELQHSCGGLIAVGDRRGLFSAGAEEALRQAVLHGLPVVKLARAGEVLAAPHGLFINGGSLSEGEAQRVLVRCLAHFGALPGLKSPTDESAALKLHDQLLRFQTEFSLAAGTRLAAR